MTYQTFTRDPRGRHRYWARSFIGWRQIAEARPNAGHRAVAELQRAGAVVDVITQNVDGLHQAAGSSPELVVELHGTVREVECLACHDRTTMAEALARVDAGEADPACLVCGGVLKSATVSFGQALDPAVVDAAAQAATDCDVFLAVGTSLTVHPAAGLTDLAQQSGARVVVVNAEPTPYDDLAALVVREPISRALPELLEASRAG